MSTATTCSPAILPANSHEKMVENGYCIFENVLSPLEVEQLREAARSFFRKGGRVVECGGKKVSNVLVKIPEINWLFGHPNVIECFRSALGTDEIMFTGTSALQRNALTGWHKDDATSPDRPDDTGNFSSFNYDVEDCKVYRLAVYLQDHDRDGMGLTVRAGSHRFKSINIGDERYAGTKSGSIVIFDCRLTHAGQLKSRLQRAAFHTHFGKYAANLAGRVRLGYRALVGRERFAIYSGYGLPNKYTVEFSKINLQRELKLEQCRNSSMPNALRAALQEQGVLLAQDCFDDSFDGS